MNSNCSISATGEEAFEDSYFLDANRAYEVASQQNMVRGTDGKEQPQLCYFNGSEIQFLRPNLICIPYTELSVFFEKSKLRPPKRLVTPPGLPDDQQKDLHTLFQLIMESVARIRTHTESIPPKEANPIPRREHAFFFCRDTALRTALENNRVDSGIVGYHETQYCYYEGEPFAESPKNLVAMPFADLLALPYRTIPNHLALLHGRFPTALYWPNADDRPEQAIIAQVFSRTLQKILERQNLAEDPFLANLEPDLRLIQERLTTLLFPDVEKRGDNPHFGHISETLQANDFPTFLDWARDTDIPLERVSDICQAAMNAFDTGEKQHGMALFKTMIGIITDSEKRLAMAKICIRFLTKQNLTEERRLLCLLMPWDDEIEQSYLDTLSDDLDLEQLLDIQERLVWETRMTDTELNNRAHRIATRIQKQITALAGEILEESRARHTANCAILEKIDPTFNQYASRLHFEPEALTNLICLGSSLFFKHQGVWQRLEKGPSQSGSDRPFWMMPTGDALFYRGSSIGEMARLILSLKAEEPVFFQNYCYLLMPFRWLNGLMAAQDFSCLEQASHIIRLVDEENLAASLTTLYDNPKHAFSSTVQPANTANRQFRSRHLLPIHKTLMDKYNWLTHHYLIELHNRYTPDFPKTISAKIADGSLRIFFITSRFTTFLQYCVRDLSEGFERLGYTCFTHKEAQWEALTGRIDDIALSLLEFKPDVVIQLCYLRYSNPAIPANIPFVAWIQDILGAVARGEFLDKLNEKDITLSEMHHDELELNGYTDYFKFPTLSNDRLFNRDPEVETYDHDISFVAHYSDQAPFADKPLNDMVFDVLNQTILEPEDNPQHGITRVQDYIDILKPHMDRKFPGRPLDFEDYRMISRKAGNFIWRTKILRWVIEGGHALALFGREWDRSPFYRPYAKGPTPHGGGSSLVYNRSKINLQLNPFTTLHHRVFEVIGSGGFLLLGKIAPDKDLNQLTDYLQEGEGYIFFDGRQDLMAKINYYLKHDEERVAIVKKGQKRVLTEYNYVAGGQKILDILSQRFA
ncbi:MAG: glycosyltransferase family 1 protein [Magnetococcales bacterium]|nr:glycosyltransferase family 1 protein [Magnetococcales bacterium]